MNLAMIWNDFASLFCDAHFWLMLLLLDLIVMGLCVYITSTKSCYESWKIVCSLCPFLGGITFCIAAVLALVVLSNVLDQLHDVLAPDPTVLRYRIVSYCDASSNKTQYLLQSRRLMANGLTLRVMSDWGEDVWGSTRIYTDLYAVQLAWLRAVDGIDEYALQRREDPSLGPRKDLKNIVCPDDTELRLRRGRP